MFGYVSYFLTKINVAIGVHMYAPDWLFWFYIWYILLFLIKLTIELLYYFEISLFPRVRISYHLVETDKNFLYENLMIQSNVIHQAYLNGVQKLLFLGSSCIYPKMAPQPLKEEYLLTGILEPTNELYAIAKIAGIKMCDAYRSQYGCNFISVMPTNLYGPNDNYDLSNSHVLPALLRKFISAKREGADSVTIWGTGSPLREFLHADDLAEACLFLMDGYNESGLVNIGVGEDISILDLANLVKKIVGFEGEIQLDTSKPDGTPRKLMDVSKLNGLGWKASTSLEEGIKMVYEEIKDKIW